MGRMHEHVSHDVDDQAQALQGWDQLYEQLGCGRFRGATRQLLLTHGVLLRESTNRPLREEIAPPKDHLVFALPLRAEPGSMFAGRPLSATTMVALMPGQEYDLVSTGELDLLGVSVHRSIIESIDPQITDWVDALKGRRMVQLREPAAAIARQGLEQAANSAERLCASGANTTQQESLLLAGAVSDLLGLAMAQDNSGGPSTVPRRAQSRLQVVSRALEYIRANLNNDIDVADICSAACASRRTLQYCFEEFLHMTPLACLRALRLNEARRALKSRPGLAITEVAGELAFSSASHFTYHYKVMFDELPSQTARVAS